MSAAVDTLGLETAAVAGTWDDRSICDAVERQDTAAPHDVDHRSGGKNELIGKSITYED